jgi:hypothetical protein
MIGNLGRLGHAESAAGHGRQTIGCLMRGCSCWGGLLRGLLGVLARMRPGEMVFVEFRWGRTSVEIVGRGWDVRRPEQVTLRFGGTHCQASLVDFREPLMRDGGEHSIT